MCNYIQEVQPDFDGLPFVDLPEPEKLKRLDRLKREFGHLLQRFDNRLAFERLPLSEQYLSGNLSLVCYFNGRWDCRDVEPAAFANDGCGIGEVNVAFLIRKAKPGKALDGCGDDQQIVLVDVIELAGGPNRSVPSVVNCYFFEDERGKFGEGFLYQSICGMGPRIIPFFCDRERLVVTPFTEYLDNGVIEGGPHIVDCISNDKRNLGWRGTDGFDINKALSGFRVFINAETAEVTLKKGLEDRFKLLDVAVGPFNL